MAEGAPSRRRPDEHAGKTAKFVTTEEFTRPGHRRMKRRSRKTGHQTRVPEITARIRRRCLGAEQVAKNKDSALGRGGEAGEMGGDTGRVSYRTRT